VRSYLTQVGAIGLTRLVRSYLTQVGAIGLTRVGAFHLLGSIINRTGREVTIAPSAK
jgi:hypothetical protein